MLVAAMLVSGFFCQGDESFVIAIRTRGVNAVRESIANKRVEIEQLSRANISERLMEIEPGSYASFGAKFSPFHVLALPVNPEFQRLMDIRTDPKPCESTRQIAIAALLLKSGFDPSVRDSLGRKPLDVSLTYAADEFAKWLVLHEFRTKANWTPPRLGDLVPDVPTTLCLVLQLSDPNTASLNEVDSAFSVVLAHKDWNSVKVLLQHYQPNKRRLAELIDLAPVETGIVELIQSK